MVPKPLTSANITPSAVFRVTDYFKPTLLLDEADTFLGDSEGLRGILNSGHMRSQAYVTRVVGDDFQVCMFSTWTPKAVALIGELPGTLADRSITLRMRRRAHTESIERLQLHRLADMQDLRSVPARWALDHVEALRFAEPEIPAGIIRDRTRDNWRPLLDIADELGQEWPWRARESAFRLSQHTAQETSVGVTLLEDLRDIFTTIGRNRLESEEILRHLHAMEERLWPDWRNRGPISAQQMAGLLHPFGISPVKWKQEGTTFRGNQQGDFGDAFSRYLPPEPPPAARTGRGSPLVRAVVRAPPRHPDEEERRFAVTESESAPNPRPGLRPHRVHVRFSAEEYGRLREHARFLNRRPATVMRGLALGMHFKPVARLPEDVFRAIKSFGGNLNQLAHQANLGRVDQKLAEALRGEVSRLLTAIHG